MKRVLLVYDVDGWAWHHMARGIHRYSPSGYHTETTCQGNFAVHANQTEWLESWDGILTFSWADGPIAAGAKRLVTILAHEGAMYSAGMDKSDWLSVTVTPSRNAEAARRRLPEFSAVLAVNDALHEFGRRFARDCRLCPAGVDDEHFRCTDMPGEGKLKVGWSGQAPRGKRTQKGYDEILVPVMRRLRDRVDFAVNRSTYRDAIPFEQLPDWYASIDVFLCTSISEGSPMPPMEAMACGRPCVSTSVGDMANVVLDGTTGYLTGNYHDAESAEVVIERTCKALLRLHDDRELLRRMGVASRQHIGRNRSWRTLAARWLRVIGGE